MKKSILDLCLIGVNIIFFIYYSIQLLIFTDEFAIKNIGFFNHAVAGLSEMLGIIFVALSISLVIIFFKGIQKQLPFFICIFLIQFVITINFFRYVLTNSPGESDLTTILTNTIIFLIVSVTSFLLLTINIRKL